MTRLKDQFQVQTVVGQPVIVGDISLIPQSQAIIVRLPIGGFVWNRPTALLVEQDGQAKRILIRDLTRILQLGLLGFCVVLSIVRLMKFFNERSSGRVRDQKQGSLIRREDE